MAKRIGSYARQHHLALFCLFLIVGGGTAWALERNSIRSKHIVNGAVSRADLGDAAESVRAYAKVDSTCSFVTFECPFTDSKGITRVTRTVNGRYCIKAPGLDARTTPAVATVSGEMFAPYFVAVDNLDAGCPSAEFTVETFRISSAQVRNAADSGTSTIADDDVDRVSAISFHILIP